MNDVQRKVSKCQKEELVFEGDRGQGKHTERVAAACKRCRKARFQAAVLAQQRVRRLQADASHPASGS